MNTEINGRPYGVAPPAFTLPDATTPGPVHLQVSDLTRSVEYYQRVIGLHAVWSYPGALFLSAGGYHHHLGTNVWAPGPAPGTDDARLLALELIVPSHDDVLSGARSLHGAGYTFDETERGLRVADPWGTAVHLRARE